MNSTQHLSQSPRLFRRDSMSSQPSTHTAVSNVPRSERTPSTRNISVPAHILASLDPPAPSSRSRRFHSKSVSAQAKNFASDGPACNPETYKYGQSRSSRPGSTVGKLASALTRSSRSANASISQPISPYDDIPPTPTSPLGARSHSSSHSPASQNRLPSMTSESSTMLSAGLKRLLKKPSVQLRSGASSFSAPSDSEGSSRFHGSPLSPRPSPNHCSPNDVTATPRSFRALQQARQVSDTPGSGSQPTSNDSSPREQPPSWASPLPPRGREQKPRNVLRRKPSGSYKALQHSKEKEKSKASTSASPLSAGRRATVSVPSKDHVSPLSLLSSPRILGRQGSGRAHPVPSLTPAGAVVQAYKQQEQSREHTPAASENLEHYKSLTGSEVSKADDEVSATPYYTVFGNTSGRVVAVGGPNDRWDGLDGYLVHQRAGSAKPDSGSRSLTRKVSNRWKKVTSGGVEREDSSPVERSGHMKGRQSLQENRSLGLPKEQRGSLDKFGCEFVDLRSAENVHPSQTLSSARNWGSEHVRASSTHENFGKEKTEEGGKLWKLMKRLSTGGLRDRYQIDKAAPPVPAIPKELLRSTAQSTAARQTDTLTRIMTSPEHTAHSHTTMVSPTKQRSGYGPRPSTAPKSFGGPRQSITTRSSSPISSDIASSKFFNRSQSVRSSTSSYGYEIPPLPHFADQHILSPKELHQFDNIDEAVASPTPKPRKSVPRRSMSGPADHPASARSEHQPLPYPPRRMGSNEKDSTSPLSRPASPPIPSFSTTDPINAFSPKSAKDGDKRPVLSLPLPEFGQSPPPRPTRSSLRPGRNQVRSPSTPSPSSHKTAEDEDESTGLNRNRASSGAHSNASTTKQRPRSNSFGSTPRKTEQSPARSPLTFRELSTPRRAPLSDKEKADKWDDLLERSARAGGTLHLGGGDLMSDHLRFSNYSEIS